MHTKANTLIDICYQENKRSTLNLLLGSSYLLNIYLFFLKTRRTKNIMKWCRYAHILKNKIYHVMEKATSFVDESYKNKNRDEILS